MPLDTVLILPVVVGLVLAFGFGMLASRLKLPALVGYILAGFVTGLAMAGIPGRAMVATGLAEAGVVLLMFGLGLRLSLRDVLAVRLSIVPAALLVTVGTLALGLILAMLAGWPPIAGAVFGLALSAPSLAALLQGLDDRRIRTTARGEAVAGWGVVMSLVAVVALVLLPALAGGLGASSALTRDPFVGVFERFTGLTANGWIIAAIVVVKLAAFIGFMVVVGRRVVPWGLERVAALGNREVSRLAVLALGLAVAAGAAYLFGGGLALGALLAGMILNENALAGRAARAVLPLREAFMVPFFVGIGMLVEPSIVRDAPLALLGTLVSVLIARPVLALLAGALTRQPVGTLVPVAAGLGQIGEFGFVLAALGVSVGLLPAEGRDLVVAAIALSLVVNPALTRLADMLRPRLEAGISARRPGVVLPNRVEPALAGVAVAAVDAAPLVPGEARPPSGKAGHTVLVGYGRIGTVVADGLKRQETPFVVIDAAEDRVQTALSAGFEAFAGNAATEEPQALANVAGARTLIITIADGFEAGQVVARARRLNPTLSIVARAQGAAEQSYLRDLGASEVITGAREIGLGLLGSTDGENAHEAATTRARESFEAVAAALKLEDRQDAPIEPVLPIDVLEAAVEAMQPAEAIAAPPEPALPEPNETVVPPVEVALPRARAEGPATTPGAPYRAADE